jgi:hypothetical protein
VDTLFLMQKESNGEQVDSKNEKDSGKFSQKTKEGKIGKVNKKNKWGLVLAGRRSTIIMNDGRSTLEKA